ncbi:12017_t:CDS:2 [Acaulospora colombiana]|uniref:12017_t:CDS:1 n=1 Tax=Acaulospora colombiana TaxID=27376 RepID=A0ACA9KN11_9GLOM|nr:12017_t:CDS:2 [Acaulospora colombiana]
MSKEKLIPYFDYFDEYTADSWSYSSFIRYALGKRLLPPDPIGVYNKYKKCLNFIEQNYDPLKRSKAFSLKRSSRLVHLCANEHNLLPTQLGFQPGQYYTECPRATLGFLGVLLLLCSIKQSIDTIRGALAPPWVSSMEEKWLANLNELAKNEETAEYEYHASLNEDVRNEKMIYSSYLLESRKFKHQIDREEDVTSTKRRKDITNVSLEDDGRIKTTNVAYPGKSMDDRSILKSADSKMNQENQSLCSLPSVPSSNINCEEGERIRIYEMNLNYDGIYRMILVADVCVPTEREKIVSLVPVLEAFYDIKCRISEVLTVIESNTPPSSPSRSSYGRAPTPSPKPVRVVITGLQPN